MSAPLPAGRRGIRRLRPRTLRARLVAGVLVVLTLGFVAVALVTTLSLKHYLLARLDTQLNAAGTRFSISLEHNDKDADNSQFNGVVGQAAGTLGARVLDGQVTAAAVIGRNDATASVPTADRQLLAALPASAHAHSVHLPSLGDYRVIVAKGRDGDLLITGLPMHALDVTVGHLALIEFVVFLVAFAVIGLTSAALVRRTLRPLDRVADTAGQIANRPLGEGLVSLPERAPVGPADDEVATVARAVNTMLEQVETALQRRQASEERLRQFVADASHELRTPVAVIRSHAEFAQRGADSAVSADDVQNSLSRIVAESERMGHLVDDLLLLARLDSGSALQDEEVDLTRTVLDAVADARVIAPSQRWELELPAEPVVVDADAPAMHQVVANLLSNVRIHAPAGTRVLTRLREVGADEVELVVADDGPGIPDELAARVFERFVRGDNQRTSAAGSSGLGLPIVAAIVAAHGGQISIDGSDGTTVTVRLPRRHATDDSSAALN